MPVFGRTQVSVWSFALLIATSAGCSRSTSSGPASDVRKTAPVQGTVTLNDKPVTGGVVTFSPIATGAGAVHAGKAASGEIKEDGTYSLSTYSTGDGAIPGPHKVSVGAVDPAKPINGAVEPDLTADVKEGSNTVDITLIPKK
jgi:hypothetical protein